MEKNYSIEGLWYGCGYNGDYEEILFVDSIAFHLIIFKEDMDKDTPTDLDFFSRPLGPYRYNDDSIRIDMGNKVYDANSSYINKIRVDFITKDQFELKPRYDHRLKKVIFNRLYDFPELPSDYEERKNKWWKDYVRSSWTRWKNFQCPDLRTKDEKVQDSIDYINSIVNLATDSIEFVDIFEEEDILELNIDGLK